jgi:hypothetical protein
MTRPEAQRLVIISGPGFHTTKKLYDGLLEVLTKRGLNCAPAGSPFQLEPTYLLSHEERRRLPLARLFDCWGHKAQFNGDVIAPLMRADYELILVQSYGFDAFVYATAYTDDDQAKKGVKAVHEFAVQTSLGPQGIQVPLYVLPRGTPTALRGLVTRQDAVKASRTDVDNFIAHYLWALDSYFDGENVQKEPLWLDPELKLDQMLAEVADQIFQRVRPRLAA